MLNVSKKTGFLLINKPRGITSFRVVSFLRNITGIKKIGHAGTLDPFATGLLIMAIGRASTREIDKFVKQDKEYIATLRLGATSDTLDCDGKISETRLFSIEEEPEAAANPADSRFSKEDVEKVLRLFVGEQEQIPPMFSAKKVGGKKLYELARKGIEIERKPTLINIYSIELISYVWPDLTIRVHCTSGTYIRTLGHEIGQKLGVGAYLTSLERTKIGNLSVDKSLSLEEVTSQNWQDKVLSLN